MPLDVPSPESDERHEADAGPAHYLRSVADASLEMRQLYASLVEPSEGRYRELLDLAADVIYTVDTTGTFTSANAAAERVTGYSLHELLGSHLSMVVAPEYLAEIEARTKRRLAGEDPTTRYEVEIVKRSGERVLLEINNRIMIRDGTPIGFLGVARDLSERRRERERLVYLAGHDSLTGLSNRLAFETAMATIATADGGGIVVTLDRDNFKLVNDSRGHAMGDELLVEVGRILAAQLKPGDSAARLAGDEFALLLASADPSYADELVRRIQSGLDDAGDRVLGERFFLGAAAGLAHVDPADPATSLIRSDAAMYVAKARGRNQIVWSGEHGAEPRRIVEHQVGIGLVRDALDSGSLTLVYQPVVSLATRQTVHYEALARLRQTDGSLASPAALFEAAHRLRLTPLLDAQVIETVSGDLHRRPDLRAFVTSLPGLWPTTGCFGACSNGFWPSRRSKPG